MYTYRRMKKTAECIRQSPWCGALEQVNCAASLRMRRTQSACFTQLYCPHTRCTHHAPC